MRRLALAAALATAAACDPSPAAPRLGDRAGAIIGGSTDAGHPAVVFMQLPAGRCTGALVSPRVVLTAAHCVADAIEDDRTDEGTVSFGAGGAAGFDEEVDVVDMAMYRLYQPPAFQQYDIAMVRLATPVTDVAPVPINFEPLSDDLVGLPVVTVGFGMTDPETMAGVGTKRKVDLTVDDVTAYHLGVGDATSNTCQGDSGGPTFGRPFGDEERIVGVTSFGPDLCRGRTSLTRTDIYQEWAETVIDAWDGPCQLDGTCQTDGCRHPDPDCDPCGFDGACASDCAAPDLDCPLGLRGGDDCVEDAACEGRRCLTAPDAPDVRYCSQACDPARTGSCEPPLGICVEQGGEHVCEYDGATPGTPGATCEGPEDCRAGGCDEGVGVCVAACGDDAPACDEGSECRDGFCRLPDDGGCGCRAGADRRSAGGVALLALALLMARRARRRRC